MARKINVLIPNATGPTNVGDETILHSLIELLRESGANMQVTILTSDPALCKKEKDLFFDENLYEFAMSDSFNFSKKLSRSIQVFIGFFLLKVKLKFLIKNKGLLKIINYYEKADLIVYVGGGSLRTVKGVKNSFIFLIILMIYAYANLFKTKKILTPASFGPFYGNWQYKIAAKIIEKSDVVSFREIYSCKAFKKYSDKKFIKSTDLALLLKNKKLNKKKSDFTVGFTIRNWLNAKEQNNLEKSYAIGLRNLYKKSKVNIQPIVHVNVTSVSQHNDLKATKNVINVLQQYNVKINKEIIIKDLDSAIKTYSGINLLLGMRMHSNIIAATLGIPFVAVGYEYKTRGIARDLGVEEYCLKVEEVNDKNLSQLLIKAYQNKNRLKKTILNSLAKIKIYENARWNKIFRSYPSVS